MTLLQAIERVVELSDDSKMSKEFMEKAKAELQLLASSFGITERQAVLFCVCMEKGPHRVDYSDLACHLDIKKITALGYASDIDALVRRRLLKFRDVKDEDVFDIPTAVIRCLKHNEVYELPRRTGLDCAEMFELLDQWFEDLDDDAISLRELEEEIQKLFDENKQISFVRKLREYYLSEHEEAMAAFFCHRLVNRDDDDIRFGQLEDLYDTKADFNKAKVSLRCGNHKLMRKKLIEHRCEDGIANTTRYKLTEEAKRTLLAELKIDTTEEKLADAIKARDLTEKKMFYVKENEQQVSELLSFLMPDKYSEIHERMQQTGFRTGFACLFYGGPGTGKTETAYQLARQTGRDIMQGAVRPLSRAGEASQADAHPALQRGRRHHWYPQAGSTECGGQDGELHPKHHPAGDGAARRHYDCNHQPDAEPRHSLRAPLPLQNQVRETHRRSPYPHLALDDPRPQRTAGPYTGLEIRL